MAFLLLPVVPAAAQLNAIGNVENAVGTVAVQRADGRVDRIRGKGSLPLYADILSSIRHQRGETTRRHG